MSMYEAQMGPQKGDTPKLGAMAPYILLEPPLLPTLAHCTRIVMVIYR